MHNVEAAKQKDTNGLARQIAKGCRNRRGMLHTKTEWLA
jgi:hypothetical protein